MIVPSRLRRLALAALLALVPAAMSTPADAHHPGHKLDSVMGDREKYFQAVDKPAPPFDLRDASGKAVTLADLRGTVVVLNFVYASCGDVCPLHSERIAEVQSMVNDTPMKDLVRFVTVTTDPAQDGPEAMKAYGPTHGLDSVSWTFLTTRPGQPEDATRRLAEAYGHAFTKTDDGEQMHGIVTHVIDRAGVWRANFHGLRFSPTNLVLYVNGLTNERRPLVDNSN